MTTYRHRAAIVAALSLLAFAGCSKTDRAAGTDPAASKPAEKAPATPAEPAPAAAPADTPATAVKGPVKINAKALFADFGPGGDTMALLDKYHDGATVDGVVKTAPGDGANSLIMDVDGKNHILMDFTDAASIKGVKVGQTITATCTIGGEVDTMMQVTGCTRVK